MANKKSASASDARILSSRIVYRSRVFNVTSSQVIEPGGVRARRDIVRHPGSVVILPLDESRSEPRLLLIRQYRFAAAKSLWEIPAGRIDPGETPLAAARRELIEETGYSASEWKRVLFYYPSPGFLDETMSIFLARGLQRGKAHPEEDERITSRFFPLSRAIQLVMENKIQDGKAISGILWLSRKIRRDAI